MSLLIQLLQLINLRLESVKVFWLWGIELFCQKNHRYNFITTVLADLYFLNEMALRVFKSLELIF